MPSMVQALMESLGVSLFLEEEEAFDEGLRCLGIVENSVYFLDNLEIKKGVSIWTSGDSWLPFDSVELDEWMVIAKPGKHLIICERESEIVQLPTIPDDIELVYWDREKFESVLGKAVLGGYLKLLSESNTLKEQSSMMNEIDSELSESEMKSTFPIGDMDSKLALKSSIRADEVLESLGIGGISTRPVMIRCRFWQISGYLVGPNGEEDYRQWLFLEDPFSDQFEKIANAEYLGNVPNFEVIERVFDLDSDGILEKIPDLCNERRKQNVESEDGKVQISGKLLRWWRIDESRITLDKRIVLIPCWHIIHPLEGNSLIHGRTGSLISLINRVNSN